MPVEQIEVDQRIIRSTFLDMHHLMGTTESARQTTDWEPQDEACRVE